MEQEVYTEGKKGKVLWGIFCHKHFPISVVVNELKSENWKISVIWQEGCEAVSLKMFLTFRRFVWTFLVSYIGPQLANSWKWWFIFPFKERGRISLSVPPIFPDRIKSVQVRSSHYVPPRFHWCKKCLLFFAHTCGANRKSVEGNNVSKSGANEA